MLNELILRISGLLARLFPMECMEPEFMRRAMLGLLLIAPLAALSGVQVVNSRMSSSPMPSVTRRLPASRSA